MKFCNICKATKENIKFYKRSTKLSKDGLCGSCIDCDKKRQKYFKRTKYGVLSTMYNRQVSHSRKREHNKPSYTRIEFIEKYINDNYFLDIYSKWASSGYIKNLMPSADRIDNSLGYCFDNICMTTWEINDLNGKRNSKMCIDISTHRAVVSYSKEGDIVKKYKSISSAARDMEVTHGSIVCACKGKSKTSCGLVWEYL